MSNSEIRSNTKNPLHARDERERFILALKSRIHVNVAWSPEKGLSFLGQEKVMSKTFRVLEKGDMGIIIKWLNIHVLPFPFLFTILLPQIHITVHFLLFVVHNMFPTNTILSLISSFQCYNRLRRKRNFQF